MKLKMLAFTMLFLSSNFAIAQRQWEQTNGPYGGNVWSIITAPGDNIYAATSRGIYRSSNSGTTWIELGNFPHGATAPVINSEGHLFAIENTPDSSRGSLYRSLDLGNTWNLVFESDVILSIAFNPQGDIFILSDSLYFSVDNGENWKGRLLITEANSYMVLNSVGHIFVVSGDSLYVSVDDGENWTVNESISQEKIVFNSQDHLITTDGYSLYVSTDNGNTWIKMNSLPDFTFINKIVLNSKDEIFVASSSWKIYKSSDNGASWEYLMDTYYSPLIRINSNDDIFVAFFENGIRRSTDDGATWEIINDGLAYPNISTIAFDSDDNIYAGTYKGVFRSFDNGDNWEFASTGLNSNNIASLDVNDSDDIFAATNSELYRSEDKGENWTMIYQVRVDTTITFVRIFESGDIYIAQYDSRCQDCGMGGAHVLRSRDNGDSWEDLFIEQASAVSFIGFNETGDLMIKTYQGWYISSDDGETFVKQPDTFTFIYDTINTQTGASFRINENSIEKSTDNGSSWEKTLTIESPPYLFSLDINSQDHLFAAAHENPYYSDTSMVYRSTDEGETWETVFFIEGIRIQEVLIGSNDHLYLASDEGVYLSLDNGDNWTAINEELEVLNITDIVLDNTGTLYAAALNAGVWKYDLMVSTKSLKRSTDFSIYPNPSSGLITINIPDKILSTSIRLDIFNIQGMLVKSFPLMNSKLTIDVSDLVPGLYLINVSGLKKGQLVIVR